MGDNSFLVCCSLFDGKNTKKFPEIFSPAHYPSIFSSGPRRWGREGQWECHRHSSDRGSCPLPGWDGCRRKSFHNLRPGKGLPGEAELGGSGGGLRGGDGRTGGGSRRKGRVLRRTAHQKGQSEKKRKMRFIKQNSFLYRHCSTAERRMPETKGYRGGQGQPDKTVGR